MRTRVPDFPKVSTIEKCTVLAGLATWLQYPALGIQTTHSGDSVTILTVHQVLSMGEVTVV